MGIIDLNGNDMASNDEADLDPRMRHLGKFSIPTKYIHHHFDDILHLMRDMVIVKAEYGWDIKSIEYLAVSPKYFDAIPMNESAPWYTLETTSSGTIIATRET